MPHVVLAVAEPPLAVLPGFPPEDGREAHQEGTLGKRARQRRPDRWDKFCTTFETVFPWSVMVDAGTLVKAIHRRQDRVSLRGVQVSARRIGPQRPPGPLSALPCGQGQSVAKEDRDRVDGQRGRLHALADVELPVRHLPTRLRERKPNQGGAVVASERIRLRGPVHVAPVSYTHLRA